MARIFAHLNDSVVVELIPELDDITKEWNADFLKNNCVDVTSVTPAVEIGWVRGTDGSFAPAPAPILTPAQQLNQAAIAGCAVVYTAKPTLSGTYDASGQRWSQMRQEAQYVATFGAFSGSLSELDWPVKAGNAVFTTVDDFKTVVRAIADWLTGWQRFVDGKQTAPSLPVTID